MSIYWIAITMAASGLICLLFCIGYCLRKLGTPTKGADIDSQARPNRALVVIDIQEDFTRNSGRNGFDPALRDAALAEVHREIEAARAEGHEVVFVKNIFRDWPVIAAMKLTAGGIGTPGREGLKLDHTLDVGDAPVFEKSIGDTFSCADFEAWLDKKRVGRLILIGLDTCHCVQLTAKGALARGYRVEIREAATLSSTPQKWPPLKRQLDAAGVVFA
ncbi:cysteine hydrolase [Labrenzia sp. OB1]|uniref:cysteine hydrolase family protein n=1 Tax=Labrenzia sp. OB1 TaxID=1561204 RepID=UPI0007B1CBE6|nr:cysteine hydrolase [Labrenzia sp. OB1]KZM51551.1 isochorismatase [Labrenzia sp. OB1]